MQKLKTTALAFAISLLPILAHASVITFEDAVIGTETARVKNFTSGGFDFVLAGRSATLSDSQACLPFCPANGTTIALAPSGGSSLSMAKSDGGAFGLLGFQGTDAFNWFKLVSPELIPNNIDVTGQLWGGGTVTQSFLVNKTPGSNGALSFSDYVFNNSFTNLRSASFSSSGSLFPSYNGFAIDNINVAAVPEPETYTLLLAGLAAIGGIARRRRGF